MRPWVFIVMAACAEPGVSTALCVGEATPSVSLTVRNQDGLDETSQVEFSHDDGMYQPCERLEMGAWVCGRDLVGDIRVRLIPDFGEIVERSYLVEAEGCRVFTESDTLEYTRTDGCGQVGRASINLTVTDGEEPILEADARWRRAAGTEWSSCFRFIDRFSCAMEEAGDLLVEASAPGFETQVVGATVLKDECNVITEVVRVVLTAP